MNIFKTIARILFFRFTCEEMGQLSTKHLAAGIAGTWLVGMGRYWDDPGASVLQHLGLGSVIYIFVLAFLVWLIVKPLKVNGWNYTIVLTFISLTSFPAILYAIPVERFFPITTANTINVWFLAVVAVWRLLLLYFFLKRFAGLVSGEVLTITLMPICLIIATLTFLNLHRVVFNIMGGIRTQTAHDDSYMVLIVLTAGSVILIGPLLIAYGVIIYLRNKKLKHIDKKPCQLL
ncbi:hypothetical protein [Foetidibacter luteolus]|uniref:hypothetical protein n=1 Tax=Foetidibacter luteolus TaxID=2608880 RepID=UPI00129BB30A|nr:hypothetical protein [Foetidibacter luteolus]